MFGAFYIPQTKTIREEQDTITDHKSVGVTAIQKFAYDDLGRLQSVKYYANNSITIVLEEYTLTYKTDSSLGAKNQIGTETITTRYGGTPVTKTKSYNYDGLGRLVSETVNGIETCYTYDDAGNRLTMTQGTSTLYYHYNHYGEQNYYDQLYCIDTDNNLLTTGDNVTYEYDLSGNQKSKTEGNTVDTYYYDDANWLISVTRKAGQDPASELASFEYDAEGQRMQKTVNSVDTNYFYSGLDLLYTKDGNGDIIEQNVLETDGSVINSKRVNGDDYWYRLNLQGSVTNIVDVSDNVIKSYTYDAFGNTSSTGTFVNSFAYTGAVIDAETGLYYMNARYYDPETSRFISQDTYRGQGEGFWHVYLYCNGDPVNSIDETGHYDMSIIRRQVSRAKSFLKRLTFNKLKGKYNKATGYSITGSYSDYSYKFKKCRFNIIRVRMRRTTNASGIYTSVSGCLLYGKRQNMS